MRLEVPRLDDLVQPAPLAHDEAAIPARRPGAKAQRHDIGPVARVAHGQQGVRLDEGRIAEQDEEIPIEPV